MILFNIFLNNFNYLPFLECCATVYKGQWFEFNCLLKCLFVNSGPAEPRNNWETNANLLCVARIYLDAFADLLMTIHMSLGPKKSLYMTQSSSF